MLNVFNNTLNRQEHFSMWTFNLESDMQKEHTLFIAKGFQKH